VPSATSRLFSSVLLLPAVCAWAVVGSPQLHRVSASSSARLAGERVLALFRHNIRGGSSFTIMSAQKVSTRPNMFTPFLRVRCCNTARFSHAVPVGAHHDDAAPPLRPYAPLLHPGLLPTPQYCVQHNDPPTFLLSQKARTVVMTPSLPSPTPQPPPRPTAHRARRGHTIEELPERTNCCARAHSCGRFSRRKKLEPMTERFTVMRRSRVGCCIARRNLRARR